MSHRLRTFYWLIVFFSYQHGYISITATITNPASIQKPLFSYILSVFSYNNV
jgi:hypothetical protein